MSEKMKNEELQEEAESEETAEEITAEVIEEIAEESDAVKIAELTDRLMRSQAEFSNFRRRTEEERFKFSSFVKSTVLSEFLPILDNFQRALASEDGESFRQGIEMISRQFEEILEKQGIKKIETEGKPFDPMYHEGVMREAVEGTPEGIVLQELQAGYQMGEQVLRPAMVKVSG